MSLFFTLINNILANFNYLRQDYLGIKIDTFIIFNFLINLALSVAILIIFYLVGLKIKQIFIKQENKVMSIFTGIAIGYIFSASIILIMGMLEILYRPVLYLYFFLLTLIALFPINTLKNRLNIFIKIYRKYKEQFLINTLVNFVILGFILISFLRLIPPEVGTDAIWYHTDYPSMYLKSHSMMDVNPRGKFYPAVTPVINDMLYVITESLSVKESSRFVHFGFYILVILTFLIVFGKKYPYASWAALLFVTSPVIIRIVPSAYAEFPWILCWLLAVFLITSLKKYNYKEIILPAILIGGTLATKLWMLPFFGVVITYFIIQNIKTDKIKLLKLLVVFTLVSFSVPFLWYLRAFLITGNPLFPAFWNYTDGSINKSSPFIFDLASIKSRISSLLNISPFSLIGLVFLLYPIKKKKYELNNRSLLVLGLILTIAQILLNYGHRSIIPFYSVIAIILSIGLYKFVNINKVFKFSFILLISLFFLYYFLNTLLILPYGLGWADNNKYLTRILSRDNSSYFDYNYQFSKLISNNDLVATYGLWGFYYARFNYMYSEDIFRKEERSLSVLEKRGATKLLILGGNIDWLCKIEKLTDCSLNNFKLLTSYNFTTTSSGQYLYELDKYVK